MRSRRRACSATCAFDSGHVGNVLRMVDSAASRVSTDGAPRPRPARKQDPARTRRALLAAAAEEFSKHGYEGARVTRIAEAAGVAHQLITYHFGGKQGLYEALQKQWLDRNDAMMSSSEPMSALAREYVRWVHEDEAWARTLIREALDGGFPVSDERRRSAHFTRRVHAPTTEAGRDPFRHRRRSAFARPARSVHRSGGATRLRPRVRRSRTFVR